MPNTTQHYRGVEREFLKAAGTWMACRLAVMGGTPVMKQHRPVRDFESLGWAMLGCVDYAGEMRVILSNVGQKTVDNTESPG